MKQSGWESELGIEFLCESQAKLRAVSDCFVGAVLEVIRSLGDYCLLPLLLSKCWLKSWVLDFFQC